MIVKLITHIYGQEQYSLHRSIEDAATWAINARQDNTECPVSISIEDEIIWFRSPDYDGRDYRQLLALARMDPDEDD